MARLFGTDGVRGLANRDITAESALKLAQAAAIVLGEEARSRGQKPKAVIGRDPRISGEFLSAAISAGLSSSGVDVFDAGVLPTPAVAFLTADLDADFGVMISASHNPAPDNGIKFFSRGGHKLDDAIEDAIEQRLREPWDRPTGAAVGRVRSDDSAATRYVEYLLSTVSCRLDGLKVVVDCANGAASVVSPEAMRRLGADVIAIHASPDGLNINDGCGSTHMDDLIAAVVEHGADAGIAHDGDADRCLAVDSAGEVIDGDHILAILAMGMRDNSQLAGNTVVATVMANLGFKLAMEREGISLVETGVGDRYVLEAMRAGGFTIGGEQSGHVVLLDHATTGDGTLTALHLLARLSETGKSMQELASSVTKLPQVLINVRGVDKARTFDSAALAASVSAAEVALAGQGRVLLRPSGTEPVVRVMVEAPSEEQAAAIADEIAAVVRAELALD